MTNMIQPGELNFDRVLAFWWASINNHTFLTTRLYPGGAHPLLDWKRTCIPDAAYYYPLDHLTEEDFENHWMLARHVREIVSVQVISALALTVAIDPELTNELEIPGIWITRVTTVHEDTTIKVNI